jgi:hypothetical protein
MIDVKQAVNIAVEYLKAFYPHLKQIRLEEVELSDDRNFWFITLSYPDESNITILPPSKQYKIFKIDVETGEVLSMKIRQVQ